MPFDPTPPTRPAVSRNGVDLDKLRALETALRAPMPEGFTWNYSVVLAERRCGTAGCALGMAKVLGLIPMKTAALGSVAIFGLPSYEASLVFNSAEFYGRNHHEEVTPLMVADAIAAIIAREEADIAAGGGA